MGLDVIPAVEIERTNMQERMLDMLYDWERQYYRHKPSHWLLGIYEGLSLGLELQDLMQSGERVPAGRVPTEFMGLKILLKGSPGIELGFDEQRSVMPLLNAYVKR
jgi:hypothetical protein